MRRRVVNCCVVMTVLVTVAGPLVYLVLLSFKTRVEALAANPFFSPTLENYSFVFRDRSAAAALANSLLVAGSSAVIGALIGIPGGYWLSRTISKTKDFSVFSIIALRMLPTIGILVPIYTWFRSLGLIDTRAALILVLSSTSIVFATWMLKGFFDQIPVRFEEAALVDGASGTAVLRDVVLPLVLPGVLLTILFTFVAAWNEFLYALVLSSYEARTLTVLIPSLVTPQGTYWGQIAALSVIAMTPILGAAFVARSYFMRGVLYGMVRQ